MVLKEDNILFLDPDKNIEEMLLNKTDTRKFNADKKPHEYFSEKINIYSSGLPRPPRRTLFSNWEIYQDIRRFCLKNLTLLEFDLQNIIKPEKLQEFRNYAYEYKLFSWIVNNATKAMPIETLNKLEEIYRRDINHRRIELKILQEDLKKKKAQPKKVIGYISNHSKNVTQKLIERAKEDLSLAEYKLQCVIADRQADRVVGNLRESMNLIYIIHLATRLWNCLNKDSSDYIKGINSKDLKQFIYKLILDVEELEDTQLSVIDKAIIHAKSQPFIFYDLINANNEKDFRRISKNLIR